MELIVGTNTYVTLEEANEYFTQFLYNATWTSSDDDVKTRALLSACSILDSGFSWNGEKLDSSQSLEWPRVGEYGCGNYTAPGEVPTAIKNAQCLEAQYLIENVDAFQPVEKLKKTKLDVMEVEYFESNYRTKSLIYDIVNNRLRNCYGIKKPDGTSSCFNLNTMRN
jgi:hypothetical protein